MEVVVNIAETQATQEPKVIISREYRDENGFYVGEIDVTRIDDLDIDPAEGLDKAVQLFDGSLKNYGDLRQLAI